MPVNFDDLQAFLFSIKSAGQAALINDTAKIQTGWSTHSLSPNSLTIFKNDHN
jgi:hypothetical protein